MLTRSGTPSSYGRAWEACWKLCQRLYVSQSRSGSEYINVVEILDLIRQFCVVVFELRPRPRENEMNDSVLRVNFELAIQ